MKTETIGFPCNIHHQAFVPSLEVELNKATTKYNAENCDKVDEHNDEHASG